MDGCFRLEREDFGLAASLELTVDPEADRERRRLRLVNRSPRPLRIEITSYLEVVLFHPEADAAHPAFAKLFVQTERDPATGALLARRRPRANDESWPWLVHALVGAEANQWETDRMAFLGRGRTPANPRALVEGEPLSGTLGNVLDPILSLRTVIELTPGAETELTFLTGAALDRTAALALAAGEGGESPRIANASPDHLSPTGRASGRRSREDEHGRAAAVPPATPRDGSNDLRFFNGYGGFSPDGREYVVLLPWEHDGRRGRVSTPPLPWINVVPTTAAALSRARRGAGYTWARNSQANRLTPWSNDPVSDPHGEASICVMKRAATSGRRCRVRVQRRSNTRRAMVWDIPVSAASMTG